mmetsp:Transcript_89089/g.252590  ORF Transcript_89089/g.252590 Transcript_89089/m.252590 type:complete len:377 (-) Transcript_89089:262-1392(-)
MLPPQVFQVPLPPPIHQFAPGNPYLVGVELPQQFLPAPPCFLSTFHPVAGTALAAPAPLPFLAGLPPILAPPPLPLTPVAPLGAYLLTVPPPGAAPPAAAPPEQSQPLPKKHPIKQDSWRLVKIEPEVQDLADHFGLDERITGKLQEALDQRDEPGVDLEVMWEILEEARNPPGLTMIKVKEMLEGTFRAGEKEDAQVKSLAKRFGLDERATYKLSEVLATKPNRIEVLKALDAHLAASNNPSALVMLKLADLRRDVPLGDVPYGTKGYRDRPYLGHYDKTGNRVADKGGSERERGSERGARDRSREGSHGRNGADRGGDGGASEHRGGDRGGQRAGRGADNNGGERRRGAAQASRSPRGRSRRRSRRRSRKRSSS